MILVTYATTHGSTEEVAHAVAEELQGQNLETEVTNVKSVRGLDSFEAVVLGVPLYMFHLHRGARKFLAAHKAALQSRPVALFILGPINDVEKEFTDAREQLDKELAKYPWFKPVTVEIFGGKFDPPNFKMPYKLIPALKQMGEGDIRNWEQIRRWAQQLPPLLK